MQGDSPALKTGSQNTGAGVGDKQSKSFTKDTNKDNVAQMVDALCATVPVKSNTAISSITVHYKSANWVMFTVQEWSLRV